MKWIVLAIVVFIVPYTYLTLHYRKPGKAFEPYQDMKDRANVIRLLSAGFQRIPADMERPADGRRVAMSAASEPVAGGLPPELKSTLVEFPLLPSKIDSVHASGIVSANDVYTIDFTCTLADEKRSPSNAELYLHSDQIVILPDFERVADGLTARTFDSHIRITVPAGSFKPGGYHVTLIGDTASRAWALQVH